MTTPSDAVPAGPPDPRTFDQIVAEADQDEIAVAHREVVMLMAYTGMTQCWDGKRQTKHRLKKQQEFAPKSELGKLIHRIVTDAVAKAKQGETDDL